MSTLDRFFLSHSHANAPLVQEVYELLQPQIAWIDAVELEAGDVLYKKIADGIEQATDFILFWSEAASQSNWVKFELSLAFVRHVDQQACSIRVVRLDETDLPFELKPFVYLDARPSGGGSAKQISDALLRRERPTRAARKPFFNRNSEIERLEQALGTPDTRAIVVVGIQGIGKRTLVQEAFRRLYFGSPTTAIQITAGTGPVEFVLQLCAVAGLQDPPDGAERNELTRVFGVALERIFASGQLLVIEDIQHWLEEDAKPNPWLALILRLILGIREMSEHPLVMTTTRRINLTLDQSQYLQHIGISGLHSNHVDAILRHWLRLEIGDDKLASIDTSPIAEELVGYPLAARFAAALVAQYGVTGLVESPHRITELRVSLAEALLRDIELQPDEETLLGALAMVSAPLPASFLSAALGLSPESYRSSVERCTQLGLVEYESTFSLVHPLVQDYFWREIVSRREYKQLAVDLANAARTRLEELEPGTEEHSRLLPATFRLLALAGDLESALSLRQDLLGQLAQAAMTLFHRRDYKLSLEYCEHVLSVDPQDWQMRLYMARNLSRLGKWVESSNLLDAMETERPYDARVRHMDVHFLRTRILSERSNTSPMRSCSTRSTSLPPATQETY